MGQAGSCQPCEPGTNHFQFVTVALQHTRQLWDVEFKNGEPWPVWLSR